MASRHVVASAGVSHRRSAGVGVSSGKNRAEEAALAATSAPLIEHSIERATGVVYNITGGKDLTLQARCSSPLARTHCRGEQLVVRCGGCACGCAQEVNTVSQVVTGLADPSANVIFGAVIDDKYEGEVHVTIIATGFATQSFRDERKPATSFIPEAPAARPAARADDA